MTNAVIGGVIDATWEDRILPVLSEYTRIPCLSPAFDPDWAERGAIMEAARLLQAWVRDQDPALGAEIVELPGRTPVLLIDNGQSGDPIVVYGHMDKQPPLGVWRSGLAPYEPVREGDLLYGRGTADDGYATFAAVTGLLAAGGGGGRILILIEASEESGSPDLLAHLEHLKERIGTPRLVICLDSGGLSYDRLWLTSSLRGNLVATVRVDVLTEGIHSGQGGGVVPSSFRILRRILSGIEDEATGRILLPELQGAGIPEDQRANLEVVAAEFPESTAPVVDGLRLLAPDPLDRLIARTWGAALEVTGADGLPKPRDGGNVLRPSTTLKFSLRLPPDVDAQRATDALISALRTDEGAHITIDLEAAAQGWVAPPLSPDVAARLSDVSQERFGRAPAFVGEGGSIPFLADLQKGFPGTQFVATGVLGPHSNAHGPNESLHIPMAKAVTHAVAVLLQGG
jgi:acetylornithine deacetylase/succinyl-diaminopimelate desuccinylase-like protein